MSVKLTLKVLVLFVVANHISAKCLLPKNIGYQCCENVSLYKKCIVFNKVLSLLDFEKSIYDCEKYKTCCNINLSFNPTFCENKIVFDITKDFSRKLVPLFKNETANSNVIYHNIVDINQYLQIGIIFVLFVYVLILSVYAQIKLN